MRTYKNYDISENDLVRFLEVLSDLQSEIKGSSLVSNGCWRLLLFVDQSDREILDKTVKSFDSGLSAADEYERRFAHASGE